MCLAFCPDSRMVSVGPPSTVHTAVTTTPMNACGWKATLRTCDWKGANVPNMGVRSNTCEKNLCNFCSNIFDGESLGNFVVPLFLSPHGLYQNLLIWCSRYVIWPRFLTLPCSNLSMTLQTKEPNLFYDPTSLYTLTNVVQKSLP